MIRGLAALAVALASLTASALAQQNPSLRKATFAAGCFWCVEAEFEKMPGVVNVVSGYTGGRTINPTYDEVSHEDTGHVEAVEITFDPTKVSYAQLLAYYWRNVDPTDADGQFCDRGGSYRPVIFVHDEEQRRAAEESRKALVDAKRFKAPIKVEIVAAQKFWIAEEEHQDYARKHGLRYLIYRIGCGRDGRLQGLWGKEAGGKALLTQ